MEDLSDGRAGDSVVGCSAQEAELIVRQMASFHAQWWESPRLSQWQWLSEVYDISDEAKTIEFFLSSLQLFRQKYGNLLPGFAVDTAEQGIRQIPELYSLLDAGPGTLTHQDLQPDNMRFDLPDAPVGIFDWRLVTTAQGARDISLFLGSSMPVSQRRSEEDNLVGLYHRSLVEAGVHNYTFESLLCHMKPCFLYYFLRAILAGAYGDYSSERGTRAIKTLIERNIAIVADYNLSEVLS